MRQGQAGFFEHLKLGSIPDRQGIPGQFAQRFLSSARQHQLNIQSAARVNELPEDTHFVVLQCA